MAGMKAKRGRPSTFSQDVADALCDRLAEGESLRAVCRDEGMPPASTVLRWLKDEALSAFADQYTRAREIGYQLLADEILEISDDSKDDYSEGRNGETVVNNEALGRSRLRVDSRKWMLSKMLPKVYGEKITQEHTGPNGGPIVMDETARSARISALLRLAEARKERGEQA